MGTRLRPYTVVLPKPLIPIGDRPILDIIVHQLRRCGFERLTIATGYLPGLIEAVFGDGSAYGVQIEYTHERTPLGTAGPLALVDDLHHDFLVMNGDTLTDMDYAELLRCHVASGAAATIATVRRTVRIDLGVLKFGDSSDPDRLTGYDEKPTIEYDASMGIYCFSPRILPCIERDVPLDFPDLVLRLVEMGEAVRAWRSSDYWLDIGRHEDYGQAVAEFELNRSRFIPDD